MTIKIGDRIRILNDNGQYSKWTYKTWIVDNIEYDGIAYDSGAFPNHDEALISCKGLPVSLYEYEIEVIRR